MTTRTARLIPLLLFLFVLKATAVTRYVDSNSPSPTLPFTNWATAATVIQDAVNAADPGDTLVVTNGVYATGGKAVFGLMTNRVAVDKPLILQSVNGPEFTIIQGYQVPGTTNGDGAIRCVYLANEAVLIGFTLVNGATRSQGDTDREQSGGGLWCNSTNARASNCVVAANASGNEGGGVYGGTLYSCQISFNTVSGGRAWGGGAWGSTLVRCVLAGNSAYIGGGTFKGKATGCLIVDNAASYGSGGAADTVLQNCTVTGNTAGVTGGGTGYGYIYREMNNCIISSNSAPNAPNYSVGQLSYCCTTPLPTSGIGNITNAPLFVNIVGGDFRLQSNSPCINAGNNAYLTTNTDLDGNPRIVGGTVDLGAYEFQSPASLISYAWLQQYGLPTDGTADFVDTDGEGISNYGEWRSDTIPTNELSVLRMVTATNSLTGANVTWQSVSTRNYWLERATNLGVASPFESIATNLVGAAGARTYVDTSATNGGPYFYRVGVQ